ncbi:hypothetical protein K1719_029499 [Acacia pycnantha]|nr:hypothetical protein K1719_047164 [Acacia pycnantha]KAI9089220.1 hypothetical protein K1719_029499 [Acacia pycnantha]
MYVIERIPATPFMGEQILIPPPLPTQERLDGMSSIGVNGNSALSRFSLLMLALLIGSFDASVDLKNALRSFMSMWDFCRLQTKVALDWESLTNFHRFILLLLGNQIVIQKFYQGLSNSIEGKEEGCRLGFSKPCLLPTVRMGYHKLARILLKFPGFLQYPRQRHTSCAYLIVLRLIFLSSTNAREIHQVANDERWLGSSFVSAFVLLFFLEE